MRHCTPDELMDVAENACNADALPHLAACTECRRQVDELRALAADLAVVPMPEPRPEYWTELSARVHDAVAQESRPARVSRWSPRDWAAWCSSATASPGAWLAAASLVATLLLVALVLPRTGVTPVPVENAGLVAAPAPMAAAGETGGTSLAETAGEEAAFMAFLGDLTDGLDLEAVATAGLTPGRAITDTAVAELGGDERAELQRLIREAMQPEA